MRSAKRQVLRHGEDRQRAADRFARRAHDLQPPPDQRADLLADLDAGQPLGREPRFERAIDLLDVAVDHARLGLGHGEPRLHRVDAELRRGRVDRLRGSSRRTPHFRRPRAPAGGEVVRGDSAVPSALNWAARRRSQAPLGQAHQHQRGGDRDRADDVGQLTGSRDRRASRPRPTSPAGSAGRGRPPTAAASRSNRPAAPGRCTWLDNAKIRSGVQSCGNDSLAEAEADRAAASGSRTASRGISSGIGCRLIRAALDEDQIAAVKQPGDQGEQIAREIARAQFIASAHQQCRAARGEAQRRGLAARTARGGPATSRNRRRRSCRCCRTRSRCRAWSCGCRRSSGEVERVEERRDGDGDDQRSSRPMDRLAARSRATNNRNGKRQHQPPEARSRPRRLRTAAPATGRTPARHCRAARRGRRSGAAGVADQRALRHPELEPAIH